MVASRRYLMYYQGPQGSVLGPVLFIIFIHSMVKLAERAELFLYADDFKLFKEINSPDDAEALQEDLDTLYDWSNYSFITTFSPGQMRFDANQTKYKTTSRKLLL